VRSGAERQFHCHVQVPWSSAVVGDAVAGADTAGDLDVLAVEGGDAVAGAVDVTTAVVAATDAAAATFTCVTGPLSPALPMRTLTLTLLGAICEAPADTAGATFGGVGAEVAVSAVVST
jgi:hypothetical protein